MNIYLNAALEEARIGLSKGGIPIGAVVVYDGKIIGRGHNQRVQKGSVILHAEMQALENCGRLSVAIYKNCQLYTTLSPCAMCSGAVILYQIPEVIIGENKTFLGEEELLRAKGVKLEVLQDETCIALMKNFIQDNPKLWCEDIGK